MADTDVKVALTAEDRTQDAFRSLNASIKALEANFVGLAAAAGAFAGGAFVTALTVSIKAAEDAAIAQRKLDAVIRATGNTTGYTAEQLSKLADSLARATSFDNSSFREATATFIRFGNVGGENLERVLRLSADYAALTGSTLPAAASKLASALNSPADGLRKLERGFGDLGPEVEAAVRQLDAMGDRAGAISLLIEALEKKIGGADASINSGLTGGVKELKKALGDLAETAGNMIGSNGGPFYFFAEQVRGLNEAIKGTPTEKLALIASIIVGGPRAGMNFLSGLGSRPPQQIVPNSVQDLSGQVGAMVNLLTEDEARRQLELLRETLRESKRLQDEYAREQERLRQLDVRGWVAYAEAVFAESDANYKALAVISDRYWAAEEKARTEDLQGWVRYADEVFRQADEQNIAIARATQERFAEQEKYWQGFLSGIESGFRDVFDKIFRGQINGWRDFVSALRDIFKRILLDFIYQSLARPFVLNIVASLAGSAGMSGLASAASSAAPNLLGSAVSGATGIGFATGAEFIAGATGTFMGPAAAGSAAAMGAQFAAFMTNPATLAVLAAVAIAVALRNRQGGPKEGGSFFGTFDAQGNLIGTPGAPGTQNGRFYTPAGSDQSMRDLGTSMGQAFATALARLGGTSGGVGFGFGFDRDPRGSAASRVSALVTDATGRTIYEAINREAGRSEEDLQAALKEEASRALLAALQASQLPQAIADILAPLDAYTAAASDIEAALAAAERVATLIDALAQLNIPGLDIDALQGFRRSGEELEQTFARVGGLYSRYVDLFTTDAERLQQVQDQVTQTFRDLGIAVPDSMRAFRDLVEGLDLSTEAGRSMWEALMEIAPAFAQVSAAAQQAAADQAAAIQAMLQAAGISADELAGVIRDGLLGRLSSEDVGARMAEMVVGGIYNALANTYAQQITQIMIDGIITPMVTAASTGAAVSSAVSAASIEAIMRQVAAATAALQQVLNDPGLRDAIAQLGRMISQLASTVATSAAASTTGSGTYTTGDLPGYHQGRRITRTPADDAREREAAQDAAMAAAQQVAKQRQQLELRILELTGTAVEVMAEKRRRELEALDESLRPLMQRIYALEDEARISKQRAELEIRVMELTGNAAGALAARRAVEIAATEESLRPLLQRTYALEDEAAAADRATEAMREIVSNIDALGSASEGLRNTIQQLRESAPGFDVGGARQAAVRDAYASFSAITDSTPINERIRRAQAYAEAIQRNHDFEMAALTQRADAERRAYEADLAARREAADAANELTRAYRGLADFAKALMIGPQSPLTGAQRLAELQAQYGAALAGARAGNLEAIGNLPGLASARLDAARAGSATLVDYQRQAITIQKEIADLGERGNRDLVELVDSGFTISAGLQAEMNALTQETIDQLIGIDGVLQDWIAEQQAALDEQGQVFEGIHDGIVEMVLNTRGLDQRIADAIRRGRGGVPDSQDKDVATFGTPAGVSASASRSSGGAAATAAEVAAMREELNAALIAVAQNTSKTARVLSRWEGDGLPETRVIA